MPQGMALPSSGGHGYMRPASEDEQLSAPHPDDGSKGDHCGLQDGDAALLRMIGEDDGVPADFAAAPLAPAAGATAPAVSRGETPASHQEVGDGDGAQEESRDGFSGADEEEEEQEGANGRPASAALSTFSSFLSEAGASHLSAPPPRRAAAAAASALAASPTGAGGAAGGPAKAMGGSTGSSYFTITDGPVALASALSSSSVPASKARGSNSKSMKRSLHRAGGLLDRSAFVGGSSSSSSGGASANGPAGVPVFLQGSAAFVDGGVEAYYLYHLHVQQLLAAGRSAPHRRAPPPPGAPQPEDWARLSFGGFSNARQDGHVLVEEPWVSLGPTVAGPPPGKVVLDLAAAQAAVRAEEEAARGRQAEEVKTLLKTKSDGDAGAAAALRKDGLVLASLRQQRELWARLLRWQERRPVPGVSEHGYAALPEPVLVKQRLKRQSRSDIKRFEREQRRRQLEKEETRRRRLRGYLQGVMAHREEFLRFHRQRRGEQRACAQAVRRWFDSRDKRVEREKDHEERARLQALKDNDMDEYIRLVERTRNERLNHLIQQTDAYIAKIADLVQSERAKAAGGADEKGAGAVAEAGLGGEAADAGMSAKARSYYAVTHRRVEEVSQPALLKGGALKEYQLAGLQWMVSLYNNQLSGILADEMVRACVRACGRAGGVPCVSVCRSMHHQPTNQPIDQPKYFISFPQLNPPQRCHQGLGKTIQTISLIGYVMEAKGNLGPFLIVVPLSTLSNWVNEFKKWAPDVLLVQYKGNPEERKQVFREEMEAGQFNVLLTTYELVMKDRALLGKRFEWEYIIVDEGHRMKNTESKFAQTLGSYYNSKRRLLLTGTPLQNKCVLRCFAWGGAGLEMVFGAPPANACLPTSSNQPTQHTTQHNTTTTPACPSSGRCSTSSSPPSSTPPTPSTSGSTSRSPPLAAAAAARRRRRRPRAATSQRRRARRRSTRRRRCSSSSGCTSSCGPSCSAASSRPSWASSRPRWRRCSSASSRATSAASTGTWPPRPCARACPASP